MLGQWWERVRPGWDVWLAQLIWLDPSVATAFLSVEARRDVAEVPEARAATPARRRMLRLA